MRSKNEVVDSHEVNSIYDLAIVRLKFVDSWRSTDVHSLLKMDNE